MANADYTTMKVKKETIERIRILSWFLDKDQSEIIEDALNKSAFPSLETLQKKKSEIDKIKTIF